MSTPGLGRGVEFAEAVGFEFLNGPLFQAANGFALESADQPRTGRAAIPLLAAVEADTNRKLDAAAKPLHRRSAFARARFRHADSASALVAAGIPSCGSNSARSGGNPLFPQRHVRAASSAAARSRYSPAGNRMMEHGDPRNCQVSGPARRSAPPGQAGRRVSGLRTNPQSRGARRAHRKHGLDPVPLTRPGTALQWRGANHAERSRNSVEFGVMGSICRTASSERGSQWTRSPAGRRV